MPTVIYFNAQDDFTSYSGGIYSSSLCGSSTTNHAMVAVGYNTTSKPGYWLLKNSWSEQCEPTGMQTFYLCHDLKL